MPDNLNPPAIRRHLFASAALLLLSACAASAGNPGADMTAGFTDQTLSIGAIRFGAGDIQSSQASVDERQMPLVTIEFTSTGEEKFQRAMSNTGIGNAMPIRVNGKEVSTPVLRDLEIKGRVTIAGLSSLAEARHIAAAIGAVADTKPTDR